MKLLKRMKSENFFENENPEEHSSKINDTNMKQKEAKPYLKTFFFVQKDTFYHTKTSNNFVLVEYGHSNNLHPIFFIYLGYIKRMNSKLISITVFQLGHKKSLFQHSALSYERF